jgi:hypothetical protein
MGTIRTTRTIRTIRTVAIVLFFTSGSAVAQRGQGPAGPPPTARAAAAIDLTGTWVSVVTEDWVMRMLTPPKGEVRNVPVTAAAQKIAAAWDPARDEAAGEQCKAYGAPAVTRIPGRMRISWQDDQTLKVEMEAGNQTRLFHFQPAPPPAQPTWQGHSRAEWEYTRVPPRTGNLKVVTNHLRPGYLRKNGIPYSANATVTEYFHRQTAPNGDEWILHISEVTDPENLRQPWVQSSHFKKLPPTAPFTPEPCSAQ